MIASWEVHTSDPDTLTSRMKVKTLSLFSVLCTIVGVHTSEDVMSEEQEPVHWLSWQQCLLCQHTLTYFSASLSSQRVPLLRKEKNSFRNIAHYSRIAWLDSISLLLLIFFETQLFLWSDDLKYWQIQLWERERHIRFAKSILLGNQL